MKKIFTLAALAIALTTARASVVINETNFPDEAMRYALIDSQIDVDGDGILTDEEIENANYIYVQGCKNLKGLELFKNIETILLAGDEESYSSITSIDLSKFPKLFRFEIEDYALTSLDATYSPNLWNVCVVRCREFTSIKVDSERDDLAVYLNHLPKLTSMENCVFNHVSYVEFYKTGIQNIDMSNHPTLTSLCAKGDDEGDYELNSINVSGCNNLWDLQIDHVKLQSIRLNALPRFYAIALYNCHTTNLAVENMANLGGITCSGCEIRNLTIKGCPVLNGVSCADNSLHNLIIDDSPALYSLHVENNMLMWLDMSNVTKEVDDQTYWYSADNQHPSATAYKLSPTEVGLRVHERMVPARMLNLVTNGKSVTATETTIDGTRYIVFSNEGVNAESLKGKNSTYEYETKWPYNWIEGSENTKDNNLPVNLYISSVTKHQAFLKLSTTRVTGKFNDPAPEAPTVTRSQDYDGKITFSSSNESVVRVHPETGELTVVGAGTAIISVTGAETDYRLAPATQTYTVYIEKDEPELSLSGSDDITITFGDQFTEPTLTNPHSVTPVNYTSSNTKVATVDAQTGKVTIVKPGTTEISASFAGNSNYKADRVSYLLTVRPQKGDANADGTLDMIDLMGIVNKILGKPADDFNETAADVNRDGKIDVSDAVAMTQIILSK